MRVETWPSLVWWECGTQTIPRTLQLLGSFTNIYSTTTSSSSSSKSDDINQNSNYIIITTMVDVDRRMAGLNQAHTAALRRLSNRASSSSFSSSSVVNATANTSSPAILRNSVVKSFLPLAETILTHFRSSGVTVHPGLSASDFDVLEADFSFQFPPDLRAVLSLGLPSGPGFPDWNISSSNATRRRLKSSLDLPNAAVSLQITRNGFWSKSWGVRPSDSDRAVQIARTALTRCPVLIPLFDRCYLPAFPCLAGNPVFMIGDSKISIAGTDLMNFFQRRSTLFSTPLSPPPNASLRIPPRKSTSKTPRWIDFWSGAASFSRRKRKSSSWSSSSSSSSSSLSDLSLSPSPEAYVEIRSSRVPEWVGNYLGVISSALKDGGWESSEVDEMVHLSTACDGGESSSEVIDTQAAFDSLLLNTDKFSGELRRAGWSSDDVSDALCFDFGKVKEKKRVTLPPDIVQKINELAAAVC